MTATLLLPQHSQAEEQSVLAFSDAHIAEIEAADWIGSDMSTAQVDELRNALDGVRHGAQALRANEAIAAQLADMETALCQADSE